MSDLGGWRLVYIASSLVMLLLALALWRAVPDVPAEGSGSYPQLIVSVLTLYRETSVLRQRAGIAFFLFAALSTLWTSMVLPLSAPPHLLSHTAIGSIGLVGVVGAVAAGQAGRWADAGRGQFTTGIALTLMSVSWVCISWLQSALPLFLVGVVLLDFAVQAVHVTNQSLIFAARREAKSRLVAADMVFYSLGSGVGAWASTKTCAAYGWKGVCTIGAGFSLIALLIWAFSLTSERQLSRSGSASRG